MLASIALKTLRDRWKGWVVGTGILGAMLWWGMAIYSEIDLSIYTNLPPAVQAVLNIPENADAGALAYGAIYASYGALTLAALALAMGASVIPGEERAGTIGLLLANPRSRTRMLLEKAVALVALVAFGTGILGVAAWGVPQLTGVDVGGMHRTALMVHMGVNAAFYGFLALALGAWTGRTGLAAGVASGVLVVGWLAAGILPVVQGWEGLARWSPWYYYDHGQPVYRGADWGRLWVLVAGIAVLAVVAVWGLARRDLLGRSVGVTLLDRLRSDPRLGRLVDRVSGSARVSSIVAKTLSEHQTLVVATSYVMFLMMGLMIGPVYGLMDESIKSFAKDLPASLLAMVGQADMSTPQGYYQAETFSMMAPLATILVPVVMAARGLAGEENARTMGLLLANPVPRRRIVLEKAVAMVVDTAVVGFATFAGVVGGAWLGRLDMGVGGIAAASALATLLGLVFGGLALALSAGSGRARLAVWGAAGVGLVAYLTNAFLPLTDRFAGWVRWSPFHYYLDSDPLNRGMAWGDGGLLAGLFVALVALSVWLFGRRDLRQHD